MAVDVCSTSEVTTSPRISFSRDANDPSSEIDSVNPTRSDQFLLSPSFNFNFCTTLNLTPADELFSNGKIIPNQIKNTPNIQTHDPTTELSKNPNSIIQNNGLKEFVSHNQDHKQEKSESGSFWKFTRSASLNWDNGKGPKGLLRSLSIKSLSRSNSTGSALNPKGNSGQKVIEKSKESMFLSRCLSLNQPPPPSSSSSHVYYTYRNSKNSRSYKEGIQIIPVLNIPPAYNISKGTINFFGFGSFLCIGKVKKKTKS